MVTHEIKIERRGEGLDGIMTPVCSCGWRGRDHYAHNDWQTTNCYENMVEHRTSVKRETSDAVNLVRYE